MKGQCLCVVMCCSLCQLCLAEGPLCVSMFVILTMPCNAGLAEGPLFVCHVFLIASCLLG